MDSEERKRGCWEGAGGPGLRVVHLRCAIWVPVGQRLSLTPCWFLIPTTRLQCSLLSVGKAQCWVIHGLLSAVVSLWKFSNLWFCYFLFVFKCVSNSMERFSCSFQNKCPLYLHIAKKKINALKSTFLLSLATDLPCPEIWQMSPFPVSGSIMCFLQKSGSRWPHSAGPTQHLPVWLPTELYCGPAVSMGEHTESRRAGSHSPNAGSKGGLMFRSCLSVHVVPVVWEP